MVSSRETITKLPSCLIFIMPKEKKNKRGKVNHKAVFNLMVNGQVDNFRAKIARSFRRRLLYVDTFEVIFILRLRGILH